MWMMVPAVPVLAGVFIMRDTDLLSGSDTGQLRLQVWAVSFDKLREYPVLGIGIEEFRKHSWLLAHNSFLHSYVELGFLGGTLFFGAFFYALWSLAKLNANKESVRDPELAPLTAVLLGIVAGYAGIMMSLSCGYTVPTYLVLGLTTVQLRLSMPAPLPRELRFNVLQMQRVFAMSVGFLAVIYVGLRLFVRF
jgi:hypothetical protein